MVKIPLHGGNAYLYSDKYGIPLEGFMDFSASINPLGPPESAVMAMKAAIPEIVNYPDPDSSRLTDTLSERLDIPQGSIITGNGSTELIYLLPRVLKPRTAAVAGPTFSDYERALTLSGCEARRVMAREKDGFMPDAGALLRAAKEADMLFICNPNNPTGALIERGLLLDTIKRANKSGCFVVLDEAFTEYVPGQSVACEAALIKGLAVLRNFTKFYGMPGLRAGYMVAHPSVAARVRGGREPWSMNTLAELAAAAALLDEGYEKKSLGLYEKEKEYLHEGLNSVPGLKTFNSSANFFLAKLMEKGASSDTLAESLASKGILIRSCSNFKGLGRSFIRVAVKTRHENRSLLEALRSAL